MHNNTIKCTTKKKKKESWLGSSLKEEKLNKRGGGGGGGRLEISSCMAVDKWLILPFINEHLSCPDLFGVIVWFLVNWLFCCLFVCLFLF